MFSSHTIKCQRDMGVHYFVLLLHCDGIPLNSISLERPSRAIHLMTQMMHNLLVEFDD